MREKKSNINICDQTRTIYHQTRVSVLHGNKGHQLTMYTKTRSCIIYVTTHKCSSDKLALSVGPSCVGMEGGLVIL